MITAHEVLGLILGDSQRIATAISTGAGWEIWMQVELACLFRDRHFGVAREVAYPPPHQALHLDLLVQDEKGLRYAFELKVESAQHGTPGAMLAALQADLEKIKLFNTDNLEARDVIGIAYSVPVKAALEQLADRNKGSVLYGASHDLGVVLIDANTFAPAEGYALPTGGEVSVAAGDPSAAPAGSDCIAHLQACTQQCEKQYGKEPEKLAECLQGCIQAYLKCQGGG